MALSLNCKSLHACNEPCVKFYVNLGVVNFSVALTFLPIRNFLSGGDQYKEGLVFYVFVVIFALSVFILFRVYK